MARDTPCEGGRQKREEEKRKRDERNGQYSVRIEVGTGSTDRNNEHFFELDESDE